MRSFRTAPPSNQPVRWKAISLREKRMVETIAKPHRNLESSTTTTTIAEEVAAHFRSQQVNAVAIQMETFS